MEFGTVDRVEMVLYEETSLIHRYITESPDRIILATWGACVFFFLYLAVCMYTYIGWW